MLKRPLFNPLSVVGQVCLDWVIETANDNKKAKVLLIQKGNAEQIIRQGKKQAQHQKYKILNC